MERRRRRAVESVEAGESPTLVARILGVAPSSLHRWRRLSRWPNGLAAKPALGPKRRLSDHQLVALEDLLNQGAVAHGWPNHLWTSKRVAVLIHRHFGIRYHPDHVRRLLNNRLRWTSQKPQKRARERNLKEVERWIADDWPRIIRQAFGRRARIALLDEAGFMLAPLARRTLAPRGQTPILDCSDRHDRISVISAITLSPQPSESVCTSCCWATTRTSTAKKLCCSCVNSRAKLEGRGRLFGTATRSTAERG